MLLALLGVAKKDICIDYELSMFALASTSELRGGDVTVLELLNQLATIFHYISGNYSGKTLKDKTEAFLLDNGLTQEEINNIRNIMLEDM